MTHDTTGYDKNELTEERTFESADVETNSVPPLCLIHYFAERTAYPPERNPKPPGRGRVVERRGNLIILEFAPPPTLPKKWRGGSRGKTLWMRVCDALMLLLLLASLLGCLMAFRF